MAKILIHYFPIIEALVPDGNPKGGCVVETLVWMKAFHELGNEVYLAVYSNDNRKFLEEFSWIKPVHLFDSEKYKKRLVWFTYRLPKFYILLKKERFDFVYFAIPHWTCFYTSFLCKFTKTKQVLRIANDNDVDSSLYNDDKFHNNLLKNKGIKNSDFILPQNQLQFNILRSKFRVNNQLKISNPIVLNPDFLKQKRKLSGYIAWIANFRYQKNLKLLFEVASVLENENFKIAGQPLFPLDEETEYYYRKLKTLDNVEFIGVLSRNEVFDFLNNSKFLLSTSRYEGFSNTFLESMVTCTPILTTSAVNPDGIIDSFGLGYIYESPKNLKEILENMELDDYLKKSRNCVEYVQDNHHHLVLGKKLLNFLGINV